MARRMEFSHTAHNGVKSTSVYSTDGTLPMQDQIRLAEDCVRALLSYIDPDPQRNGLKDTPGRVVRAMAELFGGYQVDIPSLFTTFEQKKYDEMIIVRDIDFCSTCEHHMLPFTGRAHVAYIPTDKVLGLSKFARIVDAFARRLQIQENLCAQVADAIQQHLQPLGVGVVIDAHHMCMSCRGVRKPDAKMTTSSLLGVFRDKPEVRSEFLGFIQAMVR